jgi:hypothetical protein
MRFKLGTERHLNVEKSLFYGPIHVSIDGESQFCDKVFGPASVKSRVVKFTFTSKDRNGHPSERCISDQDQQLKAK